MTIWLWWHEEVQRRHEVFSSPWNPCRYVPPMFDTPDKDVLPGNCTCIDRNYKRLPGRWREFREVEE